MDEYNVLELPRQSTVFDDPLTQLLREGARKLLQQAVEVELQSVLGRYRDEREHSKVWGSCEKAV